MNRRDFIVSAIGAATMAAVPDTGSAGATFNYEPEFPFGLAPLKQEGTSVLYDQGERMARALARSMMQTKESVAFKVLGKPFHDEDQAEDGYTYRTYKTGKRIIG